jgi:hypothetical protein
MRAIVPLNPLLSFGRPGLRAFALIAALALAPAGARLLAAQTQAPADASATAHRRAHPRKHPTTTPAESLSAPVQALPAKPPEPEAPLWPANEKPAPAAITWDSQGLHIEAANSSLQEILKEVSTVTGAKVEGFETDERIFGGFGPGPARDVLSELLQGSGYNILMIGDQGQGTPREIVLSSRSTTAVPATTNPTQTVDEETDPDDQPVARPPTRPNFGPGGPQRTPQQMMEWQREQHQRPGQSPGQPPENPQPQ